MTTRTLRKLRDEELDAETFEAAKMVVFVATARLTALLILPI